MIIPVVIERDKNTYEFEVICTRCPAEPEVGIMRPYIEIDDILFEGTSWYNLLSQEVREEIEAKAEEGAR
jgi:hypothetical protein